MAADEAVLNNVQKKILQMTGARRPKNTKTSSLHISLRDDVLGKICFFCKQILHFSEICLKVHKCEKFFSSDFEFFTILYFVKLKYEGLVKKKLYCAIIKKDTMVPLILRLRVIDFI